MAGMIQNLGVAFDGARSWLSFLPRISISSLAEIIILGILVYYALLWFKSTRAWYLLRGIAMILIFVLLAALFHFDTILWLMERTGSIAVMALVIIFQPEMRKALEQLGSKNLISEWFSFDDGKENTGFTDRTVNEIVKATFEMAKVKTGALIVIERNMPLKEIERTGIEINGVVSSQLLINIFEKNTPLHDGAMIIRDRQIIAAACILPLAENMSVARELGTRNRAALGISTVSDSITIVVSEETGVISYARDGKLVRYVDNRALKDLLETIFVRGGASPLALLKRRVKNEEKH